MCKDTLKYLKDNSTIWESDPVLSAIIAKAEKGQKDVIETQKQQDVTSKGYTDAKNRFRAKVDEDLDYILSAFRTYAKQTGNDVLYQEANITTSRIEKLSTTRIVPIFEKNLAYANEHMKELEPYGIREAGLKSAQADFDNFREYLSMPRDIRAMKTAATEKLRQQLNDLVKIYDEDMDDAMVKYRLTNPDFYNGYVKVRIIYDSHTYHKSLHGIVTDEETKEVLENVKVTFMHTEAAATADAKLPETHTTEKGYYEFKSLPDGAGTVIFEMPYYDTLHMQVNLMPNKDYQLDVSIRKTE